MTAVTPQSNVNRVSVLQTVAEANLSIDESFNEDRYSDEGRQILATRAVAQAQIATALATLMVAERLENALTDIATEASAIRQEMAG